MACDAVSLVGDGGFSQLNSGQQNSVIFALLCAILHAYDPMAECDALSLVGENPCFHCLTPGQKQGAIFGILCSVLSATTGAALYQGNGDPNGVVTANIGSQYTQLDAPGVEWLKVIGSGNTGWAVNS